MTSMGSSTVMPAMHAELEEGREVEGVGDAQAEGGGRRAEAAAELHDEHGQQHRDARDARRAEVEALRDPLVGSVLVEEAARVGRDEREGRLLELRGAAEGADRGEAVERLGELPSWDGDG